MQTLLLLSGLLWTAIGGMIFLRGIFFLPGFGAGSVALLVVGVITGLVKSLFVLDKVAEKGVNRILQFQDGTCLGAVYSVATWILVLCMMVLGGIMRRMSLPAGVLSFSYLAIGWALFFSSRFAWRSWWQNRS